jgi:tetratricopeptide (TPR) repeat protein
MHKKTIDFKPRKSEHIKKPSGRDPASREIKINFRISFGKRSWWVYALIILVILVIVYSVYLVFFREKFRQYNYERGVENLQKGNFDEAAKNFEKASVGKNESEAFYKLAVSKYNQKDFGGAAEAYQKALEKNPPNKAAVYNGLANLYRDQKNFPLAEEYYRKAVGEDGAYIVAYSNWAIMLMDNGDAGGAKKIVARGLEKNPKSLELVNIKEMLGE